MGQFRYRRSFAVLTLMVLAGWQGDNQAGAQESCGPGGCGAACCPSHFCLPPHRHCAEGPPRIRVHYGCPKPICNPCGTPNFGYFQTCWTRYPAGNDLPHCGPQNMMLAGPMPSGPGGAYPYDPNYQQNPDGAAAPPSTLPMQPRFNPPPMPNPNLQIPMTTPPSVILPPGQQKR